MASAAHSICYYTNRIFCAMTFQKLSKFFAAVSLGAASILGGYSAEAFQIYTLSSTASAGNAATRFGVIDFNSGVYTNINPNLGAVYRNLVPTGENFYTARRSGTATELGTLTRSGTFSLIGSANNIGRSIIGMSMSPATSLYGVEVNPNPNITGTINTSSGAWSVIGSTGNQQQIANTSQGGKLAFHEGVLYMAGRTTGGGGVNRFGTLNQATGAFNQIGGTNALMNYMVLTSYQGVLYGVYADGNATAAVQPGIYSINVADGSSTLIRNITGFNTAGNFYIHGASAVPAPLPMLGAAAVFGSVRKLKGFSKRLATLKKIG